MNNKETLRAILEESKKRFSPYNILYEQLVHLPFNRPIYIFALGKAAYQMTEAVLYHASMEEYIRIREGLVITRYGNVKGPLDRMNIIESSHLRPDDNSLKAGEAAVEFLQKLGEDDILLVLLSGGGTALMEKPVEGISLEEYNRRIQQLQQRGATLEELETERRRMSEVKGGKLLPCVKCKHVFIYAMSDVPGDIPKYIASNPFLPDAEKDASQMAADDFYRYDSLTAEKFQPLGKAVTYKIVANNHDFCEIIKQAAHDLVPDLQSDYIHIIATDLTGESARAGRELAELSALIDSQRDSGQAAFKTPCLLILGGTTNSLAKGPGKGGRCTETALAAVDKLAEVANAAMLIYATDGLDGIPEAAGAVVDNHTKAELELKGVSLQEALADGDSFTALKAVDAIIPGEYTGINVNDIALLLIT